MAERIIGTAADDNYVLPLLVMLNSAKINAQSSFHVAIAYIPKDLSDVNLNLISSVLNHLKINHEFIKIDENESLFSSAHITRTSFLRFHLAERLEGFYLWLDADIICLPRWDDLFDISRKKLENVLVAGVVDPFVTKPIFQLNSKNQAVVEMGDDYLNTGVLLINCDFWKQFAMPRKWRTLLTVYDNLGFQFLDQCILNYLTKGYYLVLPSKFNHVATGPLGESLEGVRILHYAGSFKPWHYSRLDFKSMVSILSYESISIYRSFLNRTILEFEEENESIFTSLLEMASALAKSKNFLAVLKDRLLAGSSNGPRKHIYAIIFKIIFGVARKISKYLRARRVSG